MRIRMFHVEHLTNTVAPGDCSSTMRRLRTVSRTADLPAPRTGSDDLGIESIPMGGEKWHLTTRSLKVMDRTGVAGSEDGGR
jgi:hypothetical protein